MSTRPPAFSVLVVVDNRDAADSLAELLGLWGFRVVTAYDGPSALALFGEHRPGVVLLDIVLRGMDGCEVMDRLRRDYSGERALIVVVSGYGREEDRRRCLEAGADHHLVKPVEPDELRRLLP